MTTLLPPIHKYLPLIVRQSFGRQQLERIPEPNAITDQPDHVLQYDQVMTTKLVIAYALGLEVLYRCRQHPFGGSAVDLACGPGHFSLCLSRYLKLEDVLGIDISEPMVDTARKNARHLHAKDAIFEIGDITDL